MDQERFDRPVPNDGLQPPFQFGLRTMLGGIAALAAILAVIKWAGMAGIFFLLLLLVAVTAAYQWSRGRPLVAFNIVWPTIMLMCLVLAELTQPRSRPQSPRTTCTHHLASIGFALGAYHQTYGSFPPAYVPDANGKPRHSWRVLITPFLERQDLYGFYRFDEHWDSAHNQYMAGAMSILRCPADGQAPLTDTSYLAVVGSGTAWPGSRSMSKGEMTDGPSQTILLVEVVGSGVHWMEPRDLPETAMARRLNTLPGAGPSSRHSGGVNVLFADGHVEFLPNDIDQRTFQALFTPNGGEAVPGRDKPQDSAAGKPPVGRLEPQIAPLGAVDAER